MSGRVVGMVLDNGPRDVTEALLLAALAEKGGDDGYSWPGVETLARRTRRTERQVLRLLKALAVRGWLTIHPRAEGFGKKQTAYTLNLLRLESHFPGDIKVTPERKKPVPVSTTSVISDDLQVSPQISSDIRDGSQVTSSAISGDIWPSCNRRNLRTVEPHGAGAPERSVELDGEDEKATAKPLLVKSPKPDRTSYHPRFLTAYEHYPKSEEKADSEKEWYAAIARLMKGEKDVPRKTQGEAWLFIEQAAAAYRVEKRGFEVQHIRSMRRWLHSSTYLDFVDKKQQLPVGTPAGVPQKTLTERIAEQRSDTRW